MILGVNVVIFIIIAADVNECETGDVCGHVATCQNTIGSYQCTCSSKGFQFYNDAKMKGCFGKKHIGWLIKRMIEECFKNNRPYSYSQYWTGTR